ncbi:hypothetical protein BOX15_Mlig022393g1 [Macrostomum lignano]|uniref:Uncharacterized protein n=1 Tax=Macrostomum lignano TaxID=282301 RepID=A0A267FS61_9PLAT|nr:hypothetical protein BOX15_Mlig022393g1 [Macrostomum lignano]
MGNSQMAERYGVNCRPCGVPLPPNSDWSDLRQENFPFWGRCHVFQNGLYYRPVNESGNYLCPNCFEEPQRRQEEQQRMQEEEQRRRESERRRLS